MPEPTPSEVKLPDPVEWSRAAAKLAERSQKLVADFLSKQNANGAKVGTDGVGDPAHIGQAFFEMTARMMTDPARLFQAQMSLWSDYLTLWQRTTARFLGGPAEPVVAPARDDKRFKDAAWNESVVYDYLKQSYLLTARWLQNTVHGVEGLDEKTAQKVDFYTRQFVDAMAPSNFVLTNPEVLRTTMETGGENLLKGLQHMLDDLERGKGKLAIKMTDYDAFEVGKNIAVTPGKVVYQNDMFQLLQYSPSTEQVFQRPLLIIPPWINKFYILDLREKNSFIKWAVDQGLTVFVMAWINPDERYRDKSFENYMTEGVLEALTQVEAATGEKDLNVIGYCIGGTLTAATLSYMAVKKDQRVKSATFFTTLTDFTDPGELAVFIDDDQIGALEAKMAEKGYLDADDMKTTFNLLRSNDLIWSFVVNNYLLGKDPFPFDLLYWNGDSTRMPCAMHSFYLRSMYQKNLLVKPGGITLDGVPIDLRKVKTPTFFLSTREDHIAPWKSTYAATQLFKGPIKFCLAGSGHIAGVINPPAANKYGYWLNDELPAEPDAWLEKAQAYQGSWWPEWLKWLSQYAGEKVKARVPGDGKLSVIEDAPGSYVKVKAE